MRYSLANIPDHCGAGGKSTLLVSSGNGWSKAGPRSRGEAEGARERVRERERKEGERGRGRVQGLPKGWERARGIVTVVKRRLEVTTAREREGGKERSETASESPSWPKPGER